MHHRTHLWHLETLDGCFPLLDENQVACQYRDEFTHSGIQHEKSDEYDGKCDVDEGDGYIGPVALLCAKFASQTSI